VDVSTPTVKLGVVAPGPKVWPSMDASMPNIMLGVGVPQPNLRLDTRKDIALFWVMTFAHYLLNEVDLRNHDPSERLYTLFDKNLFSIKHITEK
jgi:hypothetical protein